MARGLYVVDLGSEEALRIDKRIAPFAAIEGREVVGMDGGSGRRHSTLNGLVAAGEGVDDGFEDETALGRCPFELEQRYGDRRRVRNEV